MSKRLLLISFIAVLIYAQSRAVAQEDLPRFTAPQLLLPDETVESFQIYPSASKYEESTYLTWSDFISSVGKIYFSKSENKGQTFSSPVQINSIGSNNAGHPEMAIEQGAGTIFVVWQERRNRINLLLSYSTDQGESFSPPTIITTADHRGGDLAPAVAAFENWVYIFWEDEYEDATGDRKRIMMSVSSDSGVSFSSPAEVAYRGALPNTATDKRGRVYLTYNSYREEYLFVSEDNGQTFQPAGIDEYGRIDSGIGATSRIALTTSDDGKIHLAWSGYYRDCEGTTCSQPFYRRFNQPREPDTGTVEIDAERISLYAGNRNLSISAVPPGHIFIFLERFANGVYFYPSNDYGATFGEKIKVSTSTSFSSFDNQVVSFSPEELIVLWDELHGEPRTSGIYYATYIPPEEPVCVPESLLPGDLDCDCDVDIFDLVKIARIYGAEAGDENYDPNLDLVQHEFSQGKINLFDLVYVAVKYGDSCPP